MTPRIRLLFLFSSLVSACVAAQAITEFPLPLAGSGPSQIAAGSDGNLWFTETNPLTPKIGRITPTGARGGPGVVERLGSADVILTLGSAGNVPRFFPAVYHEQQTATAFLNGLALPAGGSIAARVEAGAAIVYGATVDNRTGDPSLQIASPAP